MSDENIQILRRAICAGCLSQDRTLSPVKKLKKYAFFCYAVALDENDWVCWECRCMVGRLAVFRARVVRAKAVLADLLSERPCLLKSLSQLSTITISENADNADIVQNESSSDHEYYQIVKEAGHSDDELLGEEIVGDVTNEDSPVEIIYDDPTYEALTDEEYDDQDYEGSNDDNTVTNVSFSNVLSKTKTPKQQCKTQALKKNSLNMVKIIETEDTDIKNNETQINFIEVDVPIEANCIEVENSITEDNIEVGNSTTVDTTEEENLTADTIEVVTPFTEDKMSEEEMIVWRVRKTNVDFFDKCPPYLRCEECVEPFDSKRTYTAHVKGHTKDYGELSCDICELRFHEDVEVKMHKKRHYRLLKCIHCSFEWDSSNGMRRHCLNAHGVPITAWTCDHCDREYPNVQRYREHRDCHRAKQCPECGVLLRSFIKKHMMRVHKNLPMVTCEVCGHEFKGNSGLKLHQKNCFKVEEETYCGECNQHFNSKYSYRAHMRNSRKHAAEKNLRFQCTECGKGFPDTLSLTNHTDAVHDRRKKYECEQCGEGFHTMIMRRRHKRRAHDGKRPLKDKVCDYCGKAFAFQRFLEQHMNRHTGQRPFKCQCGAAFNFRSGLVTHRRLKHKMPQSLAEGTTP